MYLSLITDLLMLLLIYLSANLLYNLTKIMIHNRMDDYRAMMQMGSRKTTIVLMIYFQILQYAVFATIAGIVLSSDRDSKVGFGHRVRQGDSTILATLHFALILGEDGAARDRPRAPCSSAGGHSIHPRDPSRDEHDSPKRRKPGHRVLHPDDEEQASSSSLRSHDLRSDERLRYPSNTSVRRRTRYLLLSPTRIHQ